MKETLLHVIKQLLMLAAVAAMFWAIRNWDTITLVQTIPVIASTFDPALVRVLERHLWQFIYAMAGLTIVSRGNLWSCGINSMNVGKSLIYLVGFYAAAAIVLTVIGVAGGFMRIDYGAFPISDRALVMVIHWLSSPVADQIMFFGLFQTALLKQWDEKLRFFSAEIPSAIFLTATMFALGRLGLPHYASSTLEYASGYAVGLFSGYVYYRTRSLLTPMLAQAFFFGMPDAFHIISSMVGHRL